VDNKKADT